MRVTPFRYYRDILADAMREDNAYDAIPNFTAADALREVGVGRNQYIAIMQQAKSKKLLWRMNKGIVKDMLPSEPCSPAPDPWWTVHLVNLGEVEYRGLSREEERACQMAARDGGATVNEIDPRMLENLYRRGLVWLGVPVAPEDHLSVPPLEVRRQCLWLALPHPTLCCCRGISTYSTKMSYTPFIMEKIECMQGFVSNRTAVPGSEVDPLETLMYQVFVAASDRVTVASLASILNVDVDTLEIAISVACRLKFCRKLSHITASQQPWPQTPLGETPVQGKSLDLDAVLHGGGFEGATETHAASMASLDGLQSSASTPGSVRGVALVVDSEVTGYLMMGALTPAVKKHSVTLFEGGRVYGTSVIDELVTELKASVEMAAGFEGEMAALAATAASLSVVLDCVKACAGGRSIELLRKESVGNLSPAAAFRILEHSYSVVVPVAGLPYPPLPLSLERPGPTNYGPIPAAMTPWMQLALYRATGSAPPALVVPAGGRMTRLPPQLERCVQALVWPWDARAVRAKPGEAIVVPAGEMLRALNVMLRRTALLVQPLRGSYPRSADPHPARAGEALDTQTEDTATSVALVDVPLPLKTSPGLHARTQSTASSTSNSGWADFEGPGQPGAAEAEDEVEVSGLAPDGSSLDLKLPAGCAAGLQSLGLGAAVGCVRLLREAGASDWVPLRIDLGIPLQPQQLCDAVCASAAAARFLDPSVCDGHSAGQRTLQAALNQVVKQHGARAVGGGRDDDLAADVALPLQTLQVDSAGRILISDLAGALQGVKLL